MEYYNLLFNIIYNILLKLGNHIQILELLLLFVQTGNSLFFDLELLSNLFHVLTLNFWSLEILN